MNIVNSDPYSTHIKLLTKYLLKAQNNQTIIETGCGLYSSPIISEFANSRNLKHIIYYQDKDWKTYVSKYINKSTTFIEIKNWEKFFPEKCFLLFHDSEELVINRFKRIKQIIKNTEYLILHDSNVYKKRYSSDIFNNFNVIEEDTFREPHTVVIKGGL